LALQMKNLRYISKLWVFPFLVGCIVGSVGWSAWEAFTPAAEAQTSERPQPKLIGTFDAGKQRDLMLRELRTSNKQLGEIAKLLEAIRDAEGEK
jgi:hypothetical protein